MELLEDPLLPELRSRWVLVYERAADVLFPRPMMAPVELLPILLFDLNAVS